MAGRPETVGYCGTYVGVCLPAVPPLTARPPDVFAFLPTGIECMKATKACMLCHKDRWPAYNAVKIAAVRLVCSARAGS
jgi:hypothetical protein